MAGHLERAGVDVRDHAGIATFRGANAVGLADGASWRRTASSSRAGGTRAGSTFRDKSWR